MQVAPPGSQISKFWPNFTTWTEFQFPSKFHLLSFASLLCFFYLLLRDVGRNVYVRALCLLIFNLPKKEIKYRWGQNWDNSYPVASWISSLSTSSSASWKNTWWVWEPSLPIATYLHFRWIRVGVVVGEAGQELPVIPFLPLGRKRSLYNLCFSPQQIHRQRCKSRWAWRRKLAWSRPAQSKL